MRSVLRLLIAVVLWCGATAFQPLDNPSGGRTGPHLTIRNDGKFVHNVGQLQLQISNYGVTGNPLYGVVSTVPGAEWPPGSGNDYIYAAGLWVGAIDPSGIPHVSTAIGRTQADFEMSPTLAPRRACAPLPLDQIADVRESYEGAPGGNRVISSSVNPDDDGDGLCDEDFGAIGQQMFAAEYYDDGENVRKRSPEHIPLGLRIQQTSYAWSTPGQADFVGMDYTIHNIGGRTLRSVFVGIFADMDIGNRADCPNCYYDDDMAALFDSTVSYTGATGESVSRRIQMGYMWDNPDDPLRPQDHKGGDVPGYFGLLFLNHTTDPSGVNAPRRVGLTSFRFFSGSAPFAAGGDPTDDSQRYLLMSDPALNPDVIGPVRAVRPLDYRIVMA